MDNYWGAERSYERGVEVEGDIEVIPGGDGRGNFGLAEEVYSELGFREEFSRRKLGNVQYTPARIEIKWSLKVWIIHSASFHK